MAGLGAYRNMDVNTIIDFSEVSFAFPDQKPLLKEVSLSIEKGKAYLLQGPSGVGKSTFLRLLNRLEEPLSGEIRFKGKPLETYSPPLLRRSLLYIQQTPTAVDGSVEDNLLLPFSFKTNLHLKKPSREKIETLLGNVHLHDVEMNDHARTLSVGQLQRLCLVRGLLLDPEVLLLDEPTSALDRESAMAVTALLEQLNLESKLTVLSVAHQTYDLGNVQYRHLQMRDGHMEESR
ncbi:MAG: ATP-binding cassette domain-containing protein [Deltaproteobacteria bacterium]|nr:ATP-binding cassette domain-containing protein [Deltaproteobacteria bacterium]